MKAFELVSYGIDVSGIIAEIEANPELWNENTTRTAHEGSVHTQVDDILIRFNRPADSFDTGLNDTMCFWQSAFTKVPSAASVIYPLMFNILGEQIGRIIITRLPPGGEIAWHKDEGISSTFYQRFHLCLKNAEGAAFEFQVGDEVKAVEPAVGDLFIVANQLPHRVINRSNEERWTMIIDIRTPFYQHIKETK